MRAAPASWSRPLYRACSVCMHGRTADGLPARAAAPAEATHCVHPWVTGGREPVPVTAARDNFGPCGPEAAHQDFPGLNRAA